MQVDQIVLQRLVCVMTEFARVHLLTVLQKVCSTSWAAASIVKLPVSRLRHSSLLGEFLPDMLSVVEVVLILSQ